MPSETYNQHQTNTEFCSQLHSNYNVRDITDFNHGSGKSSYSQRSSHRKKRLAIFGRL